MKYLFASLNFISILAVVTNAKDQSPPELYNPGKDISETKNLVDQFSEKVIELNELIIRYSEKTKYSLIMMSKFFYRLLFFLLLSVLTLKSSAQREEQPYNIILIVADDMNDYGFLKSNPVVKTPNLDKFRETAITFNHSYCAAPSCSPSRTAFLSGMSPHRSGKYYNGSAVFNKPYMEAQETLPEYFKRIGYSTYGKGKLFHSQISKERVARNFDGNTGRAGFGPFPDSLHQISPPNRFRGLQAFPDDDFPDVVNANAIVELLQTDQEKPFFLMYGLWRPHSPYTCPQRFYDMYDVKDIEIPPGYLNDDVNDLPLIAQKFIATDKNDFNSITASEQQWKEYLRGYYACYTFADWNIGRVLAAMEKSKYAENTIVVITSDNGFHMGEKNRFDKNSLWELSAITPMAVRVPETPYAGQVCNSPVNLQDLYPTFVDYCGKGIQPLKSIDGNSIKPLLENPNTNWNFPSITYFGKGWVSVRTEQYRYIHYPDGSEELYDHSNDCWELTNLTVDENYSKVLSDMREHLPSEMAESISGRWTTRIKGIEKEISETK